jgi:hypothetical protein
MINLAINQIGAARRAAGGPSPFDPSQLTGLMGWWRADQGITLNGSDVSEWAPIAGTSSPLSQPNSAKQPTFLASGINSLPSVYHDANTQGMAMDSPAKLMDYANTDEFFVLMVETMELSSSANSTQRDSLDIIGWNNGTAATAYHTRSKVAINHPMGLIGVSGGIPNRTMTALYSPPLAASSPHWWAYGAYRGTRYDRSRAATGGAIGTGALFFQIAFDTTNVNVGGVFTEPGTNEIQIGETGYYTIAASGIFASVTGTGNASIGITINSTNVVDYVPYSAVSGLTPTTARSFTKTLLLQAGDIVRIYAQFDNIATGTYSTSPNSSVVRIQKYEYYTMTGGATPAYLPDSTTTNSLPTSSTVTGTYTLRMSTGGGTTTGATFSFTAIGYISEIIICNQVPDNATMIQLNNYLYARYALGSNI